MTTLEEERDATFTQRLKDRAKAHVKGFRASTGYSAALLEELRYEVPYSTAMDRAADKQDKLSADQADLEGFFHGYLVGRGDGGVFDRLKEEEE